MEIQEDKTVVDVTVLNTLSVRRKTILLNRKRRMILREKITNSERNINKNLVYKRTYMK